VTRPTDTDDEQSLRRLTEALQLYRDGNGLPAPVPLGPALSGWQLKRRPGTS